MNAAVKISPAEMLDPAKVRTDGGTQSRAELYHAVVSDYVDVLANGGTFPPVVVFFDGTDYWLADGFHRHAAHTSLGLAEITAEIRQGTRRDAILHSVGANAAHGLRRTNDDKRRAIMVLLNDPEWVTWNDREIGRQCHVDHKTVGKLRADLPEGHLGKSPDRRKVIRGGTTYEQDPTNIGSGRAHEWPADDRGYNAEGEDDAPFDPGPSQPPPKPMNSSALWLWGRLKDFERDGVLRQSPQNLLSEMTPPMRADVLRLLPMVRAFLSEMESKP